MSFRAWFLLSLIAFAGLGAVGLHPLSAQTADKPGKLTVQTYAVADLVVPLEEKGTATNSRDVAAKDLMQVITTTVANKSWQKQGGAGAISYFPNGMVLIVRQTDENHKEVGRVLAELRRNLDRALRPAETNRIVRVVYPIADLVVPVNNHSIMSDAKANPEVKLADAKTEMAEALVQLIHNVIAKESWEDFGGRGTIHYTPFGEAVVLNQTVEIQNEVEQLLKTMRTLTDIQIGVEVRFIEAPGKTAELIHQAMKKAGQPVRALKEKEKGAPSTPVAISAHHLWALLKTVATEPRIHVGQAPKLTTYNGQKAFIDTRSKESSGVHEFRFDVQSVASVDRRSVRLFLDFEFGMQNEAHPQARNIRLANTFIVPDQHALVWYAGERDGVHLFVTAVPQIIIAEEEEQIFLGNTPALPRQ